MNDRAVSLFEKYELTIEKTKKGRGTIIAETDKGIKILMEYQGYKEKVFFLEGIMEEIKQNGFPFQVSCQGQLNRSQKQPVSLRKHSLLRQ